MLNEACVISCAVSEQVGSRAKRFATMTPTKLSLELLQLFGHGDLAAIAVQKLASAAWQDGCGCGDPLARPGLQKQMGPSKTKTVVLLPHQYEYCPALVLGSRAGAAAMCCACGSAKNRSVVQAPGNGTTVVTTTNLIT